MHKGSKPRHSLFCALEEKGGKDSFSEIVDLKPTLCSRKEGKAFLRERLPIRRMTRKFEIQSRI